MTKEISQYGFNEIASWNHH